MEEKKSKPSKSLLKAARRALDQKPDDAPSMPLNRAQRRKALKAAGAFKKDRRW